MEIRACTIGDVGRICELLNELNVALHEDMRIDRDNVATNLVAMLSRPEEYLNVVACERKKIIGFISMVFYRSVYHRRGTALINELVVESGSRGRGVGTSLLEFAIQEAKKRDMDEIEVGVMKDNTKAIKFYKANGITDEYLILGMEFET